MSIVNGIIQAPVSIADVKTVLGETSNDLGTLCRSDKINMWAKCKPVCFNQPFSNNSWLGQDVAGAPYGISLPLYTGEVKDLEAEMTYRKPTGGMNAPFRIGDFIGYNHNCIAPFKVTFPNDKNIYKNSNLFLVRITCQNLLPANNISITDLFSNCYFGVAVVDKTGNAYFKTFDDFPLTQGQSCAVNIVDCPAISQSVTGDEFTVIACAVNRKATWKDKLEKAVGLSYPDNRASCRITVKAPLTNILRLVIKGIPGIYISVDPRLKEINRVIYGQCIIKRKFNETYDLKKITLEIKNTATGQVKEIIDIGIRDAEPKYIQYEAGVTELDMQCPSHFYNDFGYTLTYIFEYE